MEMAVQWIYVQKNIYVMKNSRKSHKMRHTCNNTKSDKTKKRKKEFCTNFYCGHCIRWIYLKLKLMKPEKKRENKNVSA